MGQKSKNLPSAPGVGTCWLGRSAVFAFGDGRLLIGGKAFQPHSTGILCLVAAPNFEQIISCGDDGSIIATNCQGEGKLLYRDPKIWAETIEFEPKHGRLAVSTGREVLVFSLENHLSAPIKFRPARAPTAIAFSGDGQLLAISHSGGVSLFEVSTPSAPLHEIPCAGGPLSVALDQTGDFLFTGLSEPALSGWRMVDGLGFRMGGYPGKPRQLVWTNNGKALLTTGGPALLVWPMTGKDGTTITGPMGQAAGVYRPRMGMVTAIATAGNVAATGWSDGGVDLVNLQDGKSRHIGGPRPPKELDKDPRTFTTSIISLAFRQDGKQLSWINEIGTYGSAAVQ